MCHEQGPPVDTHHLVAETVSSVIHAWYHSGEAEPSMSTWHPRYRSLVFSMSPSLAPVVNGPGRFLTMPFLCSSVAYW